MKRKYMILQRLLILALTIAMPLSAIQEQKGDDRSLQLISRDQSCCNDCRDQPSAAQLLLGLQGVLNNNLLLLPSLQPQLIAQLQALVTAGGIGVVGATGPTGATGAGISDYLFVYNIAEQVVPLETPVIFDSNGLITAGFIHAAGSNSIFVVNAGVYQVNFSVSGTEPNQFTLFLDGAPVPGTVYGSGAGTQQNTGISVIAIGAGQTLTLVNHTSAAAVTLAGNTPIGGTAPASNASITILRLAP